MNKPIPDGKEEIAYKGKIFEVVKQPMKIGDKKVTFESARRSPGVRILIKKGDKILLTKEYRSELEDYDYRLPGGKVFDSLDEFDKARKSGKDVLEFAKEAAKEESLEEAGIIVKDLKLIHSTTPGLTVNWELYYFLVEDFEENPSGQELEAGEVIETEWKNSEEVKKMCLKGEIREDRTVAVLLRFLLKDKS